MARRHLQLVLTRTRCRQRCRYCVPGTNPRRLPSKRTAPPTPRLHFADVRQPPWAMETLSRGRESGRFAIDDLDLALTSTVGAALAAIRAILAGRLPPGPKTESRGAEMMLRGFGLDPAAAKEIARRPLP